MVIDPWASIQEEILRIRKATVARDPWAVLGIPPKSAYKQIKSAQRKWIRRLHPDRWYASADERLRNEVQEAFYQVQGAYFESLKHCATTVLDPTTLQEPIIMMPEAALTAAAEKRSPGWFRRMLRLLFPL